MCKPKITVNDPVDVETCSAASSGPRDDADGLLPTIRRAKGGDGHARGISETSETHVGPGEILFGIILVILLWLIVETTARIGLTYQTGRLESVIDKF